MTAAPEISLDIVDIALPDSYGVGKKDGYVFFVPGAVTGDKVRVKISRKTARFSYGEIVKIEEPSPHRVEAPCPHFGACGGCTLQHMAYPEQLRLKERHLSEVLARIGGIGPGLKRIEPIAPSPKRYTCRNKIELAFGGDGADLVIGLKERATPEGSYEGKVIPLEQCLTFSDAAGSIIPVFAGFARGRRLSSYNPRTRRGLLRRLTIRESESTGEIMVIIETSPGPMPDMTGLWRELSTRVPLIRSLYRAVSSRPKDTGLYEREEHLFGDQSIAESIGGLSFRVFPQSFVQPNTGAAEALYRAVLDLANADRNERALGLYCGTGPIEMLLSSMVKEVTGIDSNPANIRNARENCRLNNIVNCKFIEGRVEGAGGHLPKRPDILVVDPPRAGLGAQVLSLIPGIDPGRIVYVSCNPSTLARDLGQLMGRGYFPERFVPVDAFPHTGHLETVALVGKRPVL